MSTVSYGGAPGLANFRDIGGLPTDDGQHTRWGILYRSDAPMGGDVPPTESAWPPFGVIDLRSADELLEPHPLRSARAGVQRFALLDEARPLALAQLHAEGEFSFDALYRKVADRAGEVIGSVLEILLAAEGPVLVHCAAGKDRTGVLVALLLRGAGVTRDAIVADYVETGRAMDKVLRRVSSSEEEAAGLMASFPRALEAPPEAIGAVLDRVDAVGGINPWLHLRGVTTHTIERWRTRLVADHHEPGEVNTGGSATSP